MKTYRKHLQTLLAAFVLIFVFPVGTIMAQVDESNEVKAQQEELEEIVGEVVDAVSKEPIAGVRVEALDNKRFTAMTKADGTFSIKLPKHIVSLYVTSSESPSSTYVIMCVSARPLLAAIAIES